METQDTIFQPNGPDRLSPEQRKALLKEAQEAAKPKLTMEERKQLVVEAQKLQAKSKAEDDRAISDISKMISEHKGAPDAFPKMALRGEDFEVSEESANSTKKTRKSQELSEAVGQLSDPKRAREIYEQTKVNEALGKAFGKSEEDSGVFARFEEEEKKNKRKAA